MMTILLILSVLYVLSLALKAECEKAEEDIMILLLCIFLTFLYEKDISLILSLMAFMIDMSILELVEFIIKRRYK